MAQNSSIEWTTHTFNPWWGCSKVSPGCAGCFGEACACRFEGDIWGTGKPRKTFGDHHWLEPLKWNRSAQRRGICARVFCASMADVFDAEGPETERQRLWQLIEQTPWLAWQLLTKRPENISKMLPPQWLAAPLRNVWLGTSVEDEPRKNRIEILRSIPAALRFLSVEPLLEDMGTLDLQGIQWVIVGGESGRRPRPMNVEWVRSIRDQCGQAGIPLFFKQWGTLRANPDKLDPTAKENGGNAKGGCMLDGQILHRIPGG